MREVLAQLLLGLVALAMIGAAAALSGGGQQPAVLEASARFSIEIPAPGMVRGQLRAGRGAEGPALQVLEERITSRGDQLRVTLIPELTSGVQVAAGQPLARITSAYQQQQLAALQGELAALQARRDLLEAGSRPQEVAAARQAVRVADAELSRAELERGRAERLAAQDAGSVASLQQAEQEVQIRRAALALARARVAVEDAPARPEAITEVEARLGGVEEQLQALAVSLSDTVLSPLAGTLETGIGDDLLDVIDTDPLIVRFPLPQRQRARLAVGDTIRFGAAATLPRAPLAEGTVTAISTAAHAHAGQQVFWVAATLPNPAGALHPGTVGRVLLPGGWL